MKHRSKSSYADRESRARDKRSKHPDSQPYSPGQARFGARQVRHSTRSTRQILRRRKRPILICLFGLVCLALLIFSSVKIFQWARDNFDIAAQQSSAAETAGLKDAGTDGEKINPPTDQNDDYWKYIDLPFYSVDFKQLLATNSDTVAFLHMNGDKINYPVVQTTDNEYYLTHAFDDSVNEAGWVFMDYRSKLSPLSENLIIYGHGRYDGTIFGSLRDALTPEWQQNDDNYAIWLSTPDENYLYEIFSIYEVGAENYYLQNTFSDDSKADWLATIEDRNIAPINTTVDPSDHILTLSTCKDDFGTRVVVHAKLIKRQER